MGLATLAGKEVSTNREVVVSPDWLEERLHDPGVRVVEVDASPRAYSEGHIEGRCCGTSTAT
ncbi:MAG TPA: hypothetical protein VFW71_09755 [Actinomycetota bacterium]|nr:hypothetical protein [Actinomycetota bacterium]